jgi:hypothetical protein
MTKIVQGTHRIKNPEPIEDGVWVTDGTIGFEVSESEYVHKQRTPKLESLPWGKSTPDGK